MASVIGFLELGGIVLAWLIVWKFAIKGFAARHADSPAAQGIAAVVVA